MMKPQASMLPDGMRLHLNHGPIDLIIGAEGNSREVKTAYMAAEQRFTSILEELTEELVELRKLVSSDGPKLQGEIAIKMLNAVHPYWQEDVTPMAAVAGAVAETVLSSMTSAADLSKAYVNNGGDIALYLFEGESYAAASPSGEIVIASEDEVRGVATSGWRGRSFSLGIADAVTVLAKTASEADVAATMIANAVDLPYTDKIARKPACELWPDSDLGTRPVTVDVKPLTQAEAIAALTNGAEKAQLYLQRGLLYGATLKLQGEVVTMSRLPQIPVVEDEYG
jgi:uncharacterized protein